MKLLDASAISARFLLLAVLVLCAVSAMAGTITIFSGQDDGASTSGPFPNSSAAEAAFQAAAGPTTLIDFESVALGYYTPIVVGNVSIDLNAPNVGPGVSGISTTTFGNLYGFNITPGGAQWYGFAGGSSTFNFTNPVTAFGVWITGIQTVFTSTFTVTFHDGANQTLNIPTNVNGGAQYFGFNDISGSTTAITITNLSNDAWGVDDAHYGSGSSATAEPSSLILLGSGALGLIGFARRKLML